MMTAAVVSGIDTQKLCFFAIPGPVATVGGRREYLPPGRLGDSIPAVDTPVRRHPARVTGKSGGWQSDPACTRLQVTLAGQESAHERGQSR